jgi:hypothetical protein
MLYNPRILPQEPANLRMIVSFIRRIKDADVTASRPMTGSAACAVGAGGPID